MANDDDDKLILEVGLDHSTVQRGLAAVRRAGQRFWADLGKQAGRYGKVVRELAKPKQHNQMSLGVRKVASEYQRFEGEMKRLSARTNRLYAKMEDASGKRRSDIKKEIAEMQRLQRVFVKSESKTIGGRGRALMYKGKEAVRHAAKDMSGKDIAKMSGAAIVGAFAVGGALFRKDFEGIVGESVKTLSKGWHSAFALAGKSLNTFGRGASKLGKHLSSKGKEQGGAAGLAMRGMGLAPKALGGLTKAIGPLLNMVSKLGPLLGLASSSIMAIVKLFIDAEAQAKELNKAILQTSGTAGFLSRNLNSPVLALGDMRSTLSDIRDQATSLDSISWGINKDEFTGALSTLTAEGVRLESLEEHFKAVSKESESAAMHAKSFAGAVQVAVAYSRTFGVSLQELTQFQAEMMTELGTGLADVQLNFHMMSRAAEESGIAQNKFFAMIRGVSADLSLYNSRLEDSVKILGMLGKVMSPRNAARFMQTAMQSLKGMGRVDRLKLNLLSGGKGGAQVEKQIGRYSNDLASKINKSRVGGPSISAADILDKNKDSAELIQNVPKEMQGEFREAILELRQDQSMNKKGVFGQSMAMRNLGPGAALQSMKDALARFGGGKKTLGEMRGTIGVEMMADQLGISEEQLSSMVKFEAAIDDQRKALKRLVAQNDPATLEALKKANIDKNKIDEAHYDDIMATMDEDTQKALKDSGKEIDYAKRMSDDTHTVTEKLGMLVDFVMNQIYKVMSGIWDAILDIWDSPIFGLDNERARAAKEQKRVTDLIANTKDQGIRQAYADSDGDMHTFKRKLVVSTNASLADNFRKSQEEYDTLGKALGTEADPKKKEEYEKRRQQLVDLKQAKLDKLMGATSQDTLISALSGMSAKGQKVAEVMKSSREGGGPGMTVQDAIKAAGVDIDSDKLMYNIVERMDASQLAKLIPELNLPSTPAPETAPKGPVVASPAATPSIPQSTSAPSPVTAAAQAKVDPPMTADQGEDTLSTLDSVQSTLAQKGIKINQSFLRDKFWSNGHDAVLEATREALFEYFMYSKMDPAEVAKGLKEGKFTPRDFGKLSVEQATRTGEAPTLAGFASGGVIPQPKSPDSVFVAARPGETILPRGAGASAGGQSSLTIPINVNGPGAHELANMMRTAAINVVHEWQRKQKYT